MVYRGDRLPAELYGNVFVVDPTVNLVSRIILSDGEHGLIANKAYEDVRGEFLASTDERFRPVNLSLAPTARSTSSTCIAASSSTRGT